MTETSRVIGVGNPERGDDGIGPAVAALLAGTADTAVSSADPTRLMQAWAGASRVVVIDALLDGSPPGTVRVFDAADEIPDDAGAVSSHGMGVGAAIALARSLGRLPDRMTVVGVSASDFDRSGLSEPVAEAVETAADVVREVLQYA